MERPREANPHCRFLRVGCFVHRVLGSSGAFWAALAGRPRTAANPRLPREEASGVAERLSDVPNFRELRVQPLVAAASRWARSGCGRLLLFRTRTHGHQRRLRGGNVNHVRGEVRLPTGDGARLRHTGDSLLERQVSRCWTMPGLMRTRSTMAFRAAAGGRAVDGSAHPDHRFPAHDLRRVGGRPDVVVASQGVLRHHGDSDAYLLPDSSTDEKGVVAASSFRSSSHVQGRAGDPDATPLQAAKIGTAAVNGDVMSVPRMWHLGRRTV